MTPYTSAEIFVTQLGSKTAKEQQLIKVSYMLHRQS